MRTGYTEVTEEFKNSCKTQIGTNRTGRIYVVEDDLDIKGEKYGDKLVNFTIEDNCYVNDKFIGTTVSKKIEVNILNQNNEINLEDKEIKVYAGIKINNNIQEIPFGNFIIEKPKNEEVKEKTNFVGYDYMIKFDVKYKDNNIYPIKLNKFFQNLCNQVGLEAGNLDLTNGDYEIVGNPFTNNESCRTVLSNIAQLCCGFAKIGRDNKVYIVSLVNPINTVVEKIDGNNYFSDFSKNNKFGKVNLLRIKMNQNVDGEDTIRKDTESILKNGINEITISDNYFLINEEEREKVINEMWNKIKNLEYLPFNTKYYGFPYLDSGDAIELLDSKDKKEYTYIFNHSFSFNGAFSGNIKAEALTKTQVAYKNTNDIKAKFKNVELSVDKVNGKISEIIQEQGEFNERVTKAELDINGITQQVKKLEDFTREQTETNQIHLSDTLVGSGYITNFKIYGDTEYFKYLAPSNNLTSSDNLVPLGDHFTLVLDTQGRAEKSKNAIEIDILLGEPLRNIEEVRDCLSIDGNIVSVTRKIGVNESNELYELEKPTYEEIGKLELPSFDENTYIYVDEYYNLNYYAKYIIKNAYSETYATKVELKSAISETEKNVNISVDEKLEKYSTTEETKGMIDVNSKQLTLEVSKKVDIDELEKYSTTEETKGMIDLTADEFSVEVSKKIGKEEVVSSINQTSDKIALKGNRISIKSNYFELTEEGKIVAISGKIGGFELETEKFSGNLNGVYSFDLQDVCLLLNYLNDNTSLTSELKNIYDVNNDGTLDILDVVTMLNILKGKTENTKNVKGTIVFNSKDPKNAISIKDQYGNIISSFSVFGINTENINARRIQIGQFETANDNKFVGISLDSEKNLVNVTNGTNSSKIEPTKMQSQAFNNNSLEELKKNIEKQENVMDIVKNSEIYKFNYKDENKDDKKHIGFIIGKKYKTPEALLNKEKNAIDIYCMASINWKCTQEILEELKNTKEELEELKKEVAKK